MLIIMLPNFPDSYIVSNIIYKIYIYKIYILYNDFSNFWTIPRYKFNLKNYLLLKILNTYGN